MSMKQQVVEVLTAVARENLPGLTSQAISRLGEGEPPLVQTVLALVARQVELHGPGVVDDMATTLIEALSGDNEALRQTPGMSSRELTVLAEALQEAEAGHKRRARRWLMHVGVVAGEAGKIIGTAILGVL